MIAGLHVECANVANRAGAALPQAPLWSETLAVPGTTTNRVAEGSMLTITAGVDTFYSVAIEGADATQAKGTGAKARSFIAAGKTREIYAPAGGILTCVAG